MEAAGFSLQPVSVFMQIKAFGFTIESEIFLPQAAPAVLEKGLPPQTADIIVRYTDLSLESSSPVGKKDLIIDSSENVQCFDISSVGRFLIMDGTTIEVHTCPNVPEGLLSLYILGSCMGCIFQQRGIFAIHGSCITKNGKAILICGESGAGKSTLAAEFIKHGWKLLTDEVAVIQRDGKCFQVVSSYPSQKLWQDSIDYYQYSNQKLTSLIQEFRKEKYHVDISEMFFFGSVPLTLIVELVYSENQINIQKETGIAKLQKILDNIYLKRCIIDDKQDGETMRFAIELAQSIPVFRANRNNRESSKTLYKKLAAITNKEESDEIKQ